jgi:hypothetical protein
VGEGRIMPDIAWVPVIATALISALATAVVSNTLGNALNRQIVKKMDEGEAKRDAARLEQAESEKRRQQEHEEVMARIDTLEDGMRSVLRAEIVRLHRRGTRNGLASLEDKEYMERTYQSYHRSGGNGIGTRLYKEFMALPTGEAEQRESK